jgi:hypothetical protein
VKRGKGQVRRFTTESTEKETKRGFTTKGTKTIKSTKARR